VLVDFGRTCTVLVLEESGLTMLVVLAQSRAFSHAHTEAGAFIRVHIQRMFQYLVIHLSLRRVRTHHCVSTNEQTCQFNVGLTIFNKKLVSMSQHKHLTKLCAKCPLHLKYLLTTLGNLL